MKSEINLDNNRVEKYLSSISINELGLGERLTKLLRKSGLNTTFDVAVHFNYGTLIHIKYINPSHINEIRDKITPLLENIDNYFKSEEYSKNILDERTKNIFPEKYATEIEDMDFSTRVKNALLRGGLKTAYDVQQRINNGTLTSIHYLGDKSQKEIIEFMNSFCDQEDVLHFQINNQNKLINFDQKPDTKFLYDIPLKILEEELGSSTINNLEKAGITTYKELAQLTKKFLSITSEHEKLLVLYIKNQKELVKKEIALGKLHAKTKYLGRTLDDWLNIRVNEENNPLNLLNIFKKFSLSKGLIDDLSILFSGVTKRELDIFIGYHSADETTHESIGFDYDLSRERIRQIINKVEKQFFNNLKNFPNFYFQSVFLFAEEINNDLTKNNWRKSLESKEIVISNQKYFDYKPFTIFKAVLNCNLKKLSNSIGFSTEIIKVVNKSEDISLNTINILEKLSKRDINKILRKVSFTGGILNTDASRLLGVSLKDITPVLNEIGLDEATSGWFTIKSKEIIHKKWPILNTSLQIIKICGPVNFSSICDGIERSIKRHYGMISPPFVIKRHLEILGFKFTENIPSISTELQKQEIEISDSEKLFLSIFNAIGPVVHSNEVVKAFEEAGFSASAATSKVLPQSPIVEKVDHALYKLRGQEITTEDINIANARQSKNVQTKYPLQLDVGSITEQIIEERDKSKKNISDLKSTKQLSQKKKNKYSRYFRQFIKQQDRQEQISERDKDKYLEILINNKCEAFSNISLKRIEHIMFSLVKDMDLIGELPISEKCFQQLVDIIREKVIRFGELNPKIIPPTIFVILMVFCARYSKEEASKFWEPYIKEVWGQEGLTQYFQLQCRNHFKNCRNYLEIEQGKKFYHLTEGGVVRPVYQHAIIPYYLESNFIDWMINNFEEILKYSAEDLPEVLKKDKSLTYLPHTFQHFVIAKDTADTAATLIRHIAMAVKRFQVTKQTEEVLSLMDSMIERTLFKKIFQKILTRSETKETLRAYSPQLQWVWDKEEQRLGLSLSNVSAPAEEKPDFVVCAKESTTDLINSEPSEKIIPWKSVQEGSWEIDPVIFTEEVPHNGYIYVLSEAYDPNKPKEQEKHIIYKREIPEFSSSLLYFRIDTNRKYSISKNEIDSEGEWIIFSKKEYEIYKSENSLLTYQEMNLTRELISQGFINGRKYNLTFPIDIIYDGEHHAIDKDSKKKFSYSIIAENFVKGLSEDVLPIYQSKKIYIKLNHAQNLEKLGYVWLSLMANREFKKSISLLDLLKEEKIERQKDSLVIDLSSLIIDYGVYSVDILHNLQSLLDDSIKFVYLEDTIKINNPKSDICYSPQNPPSVLISGIKEKNILNDQGEKTKLTTTDDVIKITWPMVKSSEPGFIFIYKNNNIHLKWPITRVSGWIEPSIDTLEVFEGEENKLDVLIRGWGKQRYQFRLKQTQVQLSDELDAKGRFDRKLSESKLWDLVREAKRVRSTVEIHMNGMSWCLFHYISIPKITVTEENIKYKENQGLSINFETLEILEGEYQIIIMDQNEKIVHEEELEELQMRKLIPVKLSAGKYTIEIIANQKSVCIIENIVVEPQISDIKDYYNVAIKQGEMVEKYQLFQAFTLLPTQLKNLQNEKAVLIPNLKQLIAINNRETWINNQPLEDGFSNLLPDWAVTKYPMRFVSIAHKRVFHVFPERLVFGGIAGQGAIDLKISGNKIRTYVAWRPSQRATIADMWVAFPKDDIVDRFSETDPWDNWPGYRCLVCGEIIGHKHGTYNNFPPSILVTHLHDKTRKASEQFADTVYSTKHRLIAITEFYEDELLDQAYSPKEIIGNLGNNDREFVGDLNIPVDGFSSFDLDLAWFELTQNSNKQQTKNEIDKLLKEAKLFSQLEFLKDVQTHSAFAPYSRLMSCLNLEFDYFRLVKFGLMLSMILRTKAHDISKFKEIMNSIQVTKSDLVEWTYLFYSISPKLFEWSMSWAEIFFVHSVS